MQTLVGTPREGGWSRLADLVQQRGFQLSTLLLWALVMNREGIRVPNGNEQVYLLYLFKAWHPHFLSGDWTFQETTAGHGIFNLSLGWLTLFFGMEWAGWVGRFAVWTGSFLGLLRLGEHFRIPSWAAWAGIVLWLVQRQSPVVEEWMIGTFEAKCVAYVCLIFAIDAALRGRNLLAGLLCGLAFSFHTAVGLWGGAALAGAVLLNNPFKQSIQFLASALVLALPGLISSLPLISGPHAISAEEAKFIVQVFAPSCLDPFNIPLIWLVLLPALLLFSVGYFRWCAGDRSARMLFFFQLFTALFFLLGCIARVMQRFDLVELYPLRVFSVFVLLLFYWQAARIFLSIAKPDNGPNRVRPPLPLVGAAALLLIAIPSPLLQLKDLFARHVNRIQQISTGNPSAPRSEDISFRDAALWVRQNAPAGDVVIAPPWREDAYYFTQRPLIASWHAPRYDAITQWRQRIEDLSGDVTIDNDSPDNMGSKQRLYYRNLTPRQMIQLQQRYHARWLITSSAYPFSPVYQTQCFTVYKLP